MAEAALVETHTAVLVMAGDRVYKAKKPVRFPFVDLTTPALRRLACVREVELNRRLAPDVYLGVATLTGVGGEPDEPVVVMRRLPADQRLSTMVAAHRSDARDEMVHVARLIAAFHASAPTSRAVAAAASADAVGTAALRNIDELAAVCGHLLDPADVATARERTERYVAGRGPLFDERVALGYARDGHGDLLADDIFCLPDGPRVLDCLEFDDTLRYGDVLADVAFLAMDVERLGGVDLAREFLDAYAEFSGATWPASLEHFYVAQRALVRAKVAGLRGDDPHLLVRVALRHLRAGRVRLVLVGGVPGTGKSTLAQGLADRFGLALLRSDAVRKQVYGVPATTWHPEPYGKGLYDAAHTAATYAELLRRAAISLAHGESVVLDATWLDPAMRSRAAAVAAGAHADLVQLRCVTPDRVATSRVLSRAMAHADISDATPEVVERVSADARPWPDAREIDTTRPPATALAAAAAYVT